jgi:8-oxo-dGTP diphosphatase
VSSEPLRVIAAAILQERKLLLVSKHAAPDVFYLPGGKPDRGEQPLETLEREVREELGVGVLESEPLTVVYEQAALEGVPMEMEVYRCLVDGPVEPRAEIAALAWVGRAGPRPGRLAPAIRNHVLPFLAEVGLIA